MSPGSKGEQKVAVGGMDGAANEEFSHMLQTNNLEHFSIFFDLSCIQNTDTSIQNTVFKDGASART